MASSVLCRRPRLPRWLPRCPTPLTYRRAATATTCTVCHSASPPRCPSVARCFSTASPRWEASTAGYQAPRAFFFQAPSTPHAIPPIPFHLALLYRYPAHFGAQEDPAYFNKPFQFILRLAQSASASSRTPFASLTTSAATTAPYHVHELIFFADLTAQELERALLAHLHTLTAAQLHCDDRPLPPTTTLQQLYNSHHRTLTLPTPPHLHPSRAPLSPLSPYPSAFFLSEPRLSLLLYPHGGPPYRVSINGGLPLSPGVQSFLSRHRWVYVSAVFMLIAVFMLSNEERPSSDNSEQSAARDYWTTRMKEGRDKLLDHVWPDRNK